jgi:putative transposase
VEQMCQLLQISRSGYYAWQHRPPSPRAVRRLELAESIRRVHQHSHGTYGSPRVHQALLREQEHCGRNLVAQLMRQEQLRSNRVGSFRVHTTDAHHEYPVAANTLDRSFQVGAVNTVWVTDITYLATDEGWLYLATVMDLGSRRIIGWNLADHLRAELAVTALSQALAWRRPRESMVLLHHSDRGVQYACGEYRQVLESQGVRCSMSRTGNCYDNAVIESFFSTLKLELTYHQHYASREEACQSIHDYIEIFYNHQRLHSSLGYLSPAEYELTAERQKRTARAH